MTQQERYKQLRELLPKCTRDDLHKQVVFYHDLQFAAWFDLQVMICHFKLYAMLPGKDRPTFLKVGGRTTCMVNDLTSDVLEAEVLISGTVRADGGCTDWTLPQAPRREAHACGYADMANVSLSLLCVWRDSIRRLAIEHEQPRDLLILGDMDPDDLVYPAIPYLGLFDKPLLPKP